MAWRFNGRELNRIARTGWSLSYPVHVRRRTRRLNARTGVYSVRRGIGGHHTTSRDHTGIRHDILLVNDDLRYMLETLAHELRHAQQVEALGMNTYSWLYSGFPASRQRLGWDGPPVLLSETGFEYNAGLAEDRWRELLPAVKHTKGAR